MTPLSLAIKEEKYFSAKTLIYNGASVTTVFIQFEFIIAIGKTYLRKCFESSYSKRIDTFNFRYPKSWS